MSQFSLRHLHMGCGEPLMAVCPMRKTVAPKTRQKKQHQEDNKQLAQTQKVKGAC